jgi:hypothetical protein
LSRLVLLSTFAVGLAACGVDIDQPWQLAHDRIIAIRAEPPHILPGETSTIDLLAGFTELPPQAKAPDVAYVVSPMSLSDVIAPDNGQWIVTAPSAERIDAARAELGLPDGSPVPLQLGIAAAWPNKVMSPNDAGFGGTKAVILGSSASNPTLEGLMINGVEAPPDGTEIVVPKETEIRLYVEANDEEMTVNWLTSCGVMHDFDLHNASLTVDPEDPQEGQLALVVRDQVGGVAWRVWPVRAE